METLTNLLEGDDGILRHLEIGEHFISRGDSKRYLVISGSGFEEHNSCGAGQVLSKNQAKHLIKHLIIAYIQNNSCPVNDKGFLFTEAK